MIPEVDKTTAVAEIYEDLINKAVAAERTRCAELVRDWQTRAYSSDEVLRLILSGERVP